MRPFWLALPVALGISSAPAQTAADPSDWLRQVYDLYHRAEKNAAALKESSVTLVEKRASRAFAALLKRDEACERKSHEICALDWDFIVDGQDWELSQVKVGPLVAAGDRGSVAVSFRNFKSADVNVYHLVREDGAWKVDDVETRQAGVGTTSIARLLRDYKHY